LDSILGKTLPKVTKDLVYSTVGNMKKEMKKQQMAIEERKSVERETKEDKKLKEARIKQQLNKESLKIYESIFDSLLRKEVKDIGQW